MAAPRGYRSFEDLVREEIRPGMRIGWTLDELENHDRQQDHDFDADPFEAMLDAASEEYEPDD